MGCLSPLWEQAQATFWIAKHSKCSPQHWAKGLCLQLLNLTHSSWVARNQLYQELSSLLQCRTLEAMIQQEFTLGLCHLLPSNHFLIQPSSAFKGFSLEKVLRLLLYCQHSWSRIAREGLGDTDHLLSVLRAKALDRSWFHNKLKLCKRLCSGTQRKLITDKIHFYPR